MSTLTAEKLFEQLRKVNEPKGFFFNPDTQITMDILNSLLEIKNNYGYVACPCRLSSGNREKDSDIQCPCAYRDADVKEHGSCYCGLYVSEDVYTGKKERKVVPERRPVERILA